MNSKIKICNLALGYLGQGTIASLNQEDERAKRINLFYDAVRDEVLRTHNWGFATVRAPLALVRKEETGGLYLYQYPVDCLFIRRVFSPVKKSREPFFELFDASSKTRVLATREPNAWAVYTRCVADETQWDASFTKAFTLALACDLAVALTGDLALHRQLEQKYVLYLEEARRSNSAENFHLAPQADAFSEVR